MQSNLIIEHNRQSWNKESQQGSPWAIPVSSEVIHQAQHGTWEVVLTPNKPVPRQWFGELQSVDVLCLASGGGQQAPILAAAGANVTSFDLSEEQLKKDAQVAQQHELSLRTVQGAMDNLTTFPNDSFDIIFHPVSNVFAPEILPVWQECFRVLRNGGRLLAGFMNPTFFLFDHEKAEQSGRLEVMYSLPFSDSEDLPKEHLESLREQKAALEFSHSLATQIGGQLQAGFLLQDFYEDDWDDEATPLNSFMNIYCATLARKM
jgi:SAM-dependent methyltransferase